MRNQHLLLLWSRSSACLLAAVAWLMVAPPAIIAAEPSDYLASGQRHRLFSGDMPPGAVGQARLLGRGPIAGYYQPVAFSGPPGVEFTLPQSGIFSDAKESLQAGMLIGAIYRFRITAIPRAPGAELYPTVEVIDRTYPPPGMATRYPIPINLDQEDLEAALDGRMVTRVILLEDPQTAIALPQTPTTSTAIEIGEDQDALQVADRFGRPVAIVRIGSVTPPRAPELMPQFFFGYPSWAPITQSLSQPAMESQVNQPAMESQVNQPAMESPVNHPAVQWQVDQSVQP